jgi:hypothetical protein
MILFTQSMESYCFRRSLLQLLSLSILWSCTQEESQKETQPMLDQKQVQIQDMQIDQQITDQQIMDQQMTDQQIMDQTLDLALYDPQMADWWISTEDHQLMIQNEQLKENALWAKVIALKAPQSAQEASLMGCALKGRLQGSGLNNIQALAGLDFNFLVRGTVNTRTALNFGLSIENLDLNRSLRDQQGIHLKAGQFDWDANRIPFFNDQVLDWPNQNISQGWIETPPSSLKLPVRLIGAPAFDIQMIAAQITGEFVFESSILADMIKLKNGVLMGYVDKAGIMNMVDQIRVQCTSMQPPALCSLFGDQVNQPSEDLANIAVTFLGNWEVFYDQSTQMISECEMENCNAISFCLGIELQVF